GNHEPGQAEAICCHESPQMLHSTRISRRECAMKTATREDIALERPTLAEVDVFGLTHPGLVRRTNADHFLVASLHRTLRVHATSLNGGIGPQESETRGFLLLVADGVGGLAGAADGSARAVTAVAQHLLHATELCSELAVAHEND